MSRSDCGIGRDDEYAWNSNGPFLFLLYIFAALLPIANLLIFLGWWIFVFVVSLDQDPRLKVWKSDVMQFPWYRQLGDADVHIPEKLSSFGAPLTYQKRSWKEAILHPMRKFIITHTIFRRLADEEPVLLMCIRGILALVCWMTILGSLIYRAFYLPIVQFGQCLPQRPVFGHSLSANDTWFRVSGAVVWHLQNPSFCL